MATAEISMPALAWHAAPASAALLDFIATTSGPDTSMTWARWWFDKDNSLIVNFAMPVPSNMAGTNGATLKLFWYTIDATQSEALWILKVIAVTPGETLNNAASEMANGASNSGDTAWKLQTTTITLGANDDDLAAGDFLLFSLVRDAEDSVAQDIYFLGAVFTYTLAA